MDEYNTKVCTKCKRELPATTDYFCKHKDCKYGLNSRCKDCRTKAKDGVRKIREVWPDGFQRCSKCKRLLEATPYYFYRGRGGRNGLCSICKDCRAVDLGAKNHRLVVPKDKKQCCRCLVVHPATTEYFHKDAHIRRDGLSSLCKNCIRVKQRAFRLTNRERLNEEARQRSKHRDKAEQKRRNAARRARIMGAGGSYTKEDVERQYQIQRGKCWWCGKQCGTNYHADHLVPLSRGGTKWPNNIVIACPSCNLSKGDKMPEEWAGRLL